MKHYLIQKKEEVFSMLDLQWNFNDAKQAWHEEGFEQGIKQGHDDAMLSVAIDMLKDNESFDKICKITKLPIERIQQLALSVSK
jgi:hypothetical protein